MPSASDVAVVGGGPAGLAAATRMKRLGVRSVVVIDRESEAGGIPRHCGHFPFGMREFQRVLRGPDYSRRLVTRAEAAGVEILRNTTVIRLAPGPRLTLSGPEGEAEVGARRVLLATGVREASRAARMIGGARPLGIVSTGALQSLVYLAGKRPFRRPVVLGSELVSFSALLTCRHAGIEPLAMIEPGQRITARGFAAALPRWLGVPILLGCEILAVHGTQRVEGVTLRHVDGYVHEIETDGVVVTGAFTPEATLCRLGHVELDPGSGGPVVDQFGRCSDPDYFAAGNLLRPVETAGWSWHEGMTAGAAIVADIKGELPAPERHIEVVVDSPAIRFAVPQRIVLPLRRPEMKYLQLRLTRAAAGRLSISDATGPLWHRPIDSLPERRILVPLAGFADRIRGDRLSLTLEEDL